MACILSSTFAGTSTHTADPKVLQNGGPQEQLGGDQKSPIRLSTLAKTVILLMPMEVLGGIHSANSDVEKCLLWPIAHDIALAKSSFISTRFP